MRKVLIANRGEIAIRVVRACRFAGLASVAVYAEPDLEARHTQPADEAYSLGGTSPAETYLDISKIIKIALGCGEAPERGPPRLRVPLRERRLRPGGRRRRADLDRPPARGHRSPRQQSQGPAYRPRGGRAAGPGYRQSGRGRR